MQKDSFLEVIKSSHLHPLTTHQPVVQRLKGFPCAFVLYIFSHIKTQFSLFDKMKLWVLSMMQGESIH